MTRYKVVNSRQSQVSSDTGRLVVDDGSGYTLPTATADIKGGVRVGANLSMAGDVLSADDMRYDDSQVLTDIGDLEEGQQGLQVFGDHPAQLQAGGVDDVHAELRPAPLLAKWAKVRSRASRALSAS